MKKQGADVIGAKAGAKPKKPYIQKDTIGSTQNAEIVYGIGDGENGGLINGLNSIILDGTRVIGSSGEVNFNEVKYEERFGLIDQPPLKLIEDTITERGLNLEVRSAAPVVSSFNNKDVDKFVVRISVPSLMQNKDNGDSVAATISYAIDISVDGGAYQTVLEASATEKITNGYEFDHEIDAPVGTQRTIRVRRTTPDSTSQLLIDKFYVAAISEVINAKFSHPTLHYIGLVFNAEQFNNIPKAVFHYYGRKIKVPVNYNPTTRQYDGIWNGTFKVVYSNNPAWVLFDILTDRRSGLGRRIPVELVDKWELYRIAQYCDELVPDGEGGMEPRFVCNNLVLNSKQDAYQVLKDIASIFRGQSFWNGSQVVTVADAPRDIDYAISMASVISYSYSGTARNARHNVVKVQYYDKNNENSAAYEYATDYDSIRETEQINEVEIRAFGCTSAGQAQRLARYTLLSEQTETRILTAKLSMDAFVNMQIGDVFAWSDKFLAGANNGGRVVAVNGAELTLDRDVTDSALVGDTLFVNTTSGKANTRTITAINGNKVTLDAVMSTTEPEFVWVIDSAELSLLYFKLDDYKVNPAEGTVDIVGIQHVNGKFGTIDTETALEAPPFSKVEIETLRAPGNVITSFNVRVDQGLNIADLYVSWGQVKGATRYTVEFRRDSQAWRVLGNVTGLTHTIENVSAGIYEVRVRAADSIGNLSPYGFSAPLNVAGIVLPPPKLASFTAVGKLLAIETKWSFPAGTEASLAVVIEHANQDPANVGVPTQKLNIPYPQTEYAFNGLGAHSQMWFRAAIVDKYNQEGEFTAWTTATADANPEELIDLISGHISEGTLDQTLKGKIDGAGALAGEAQTLANQAKTAAANAQTTATNAGTAAANAQTAATNAANAVIKEVTDRVAAVTAETNARTAAISKEATDRAAALTAQATTLKADSAAKVKALKDEVDPKITTLQNGITQVTTDYKAADTLVVGQLDAYKTSNDSAVASVLQKAESAVSTGSTNSSAITAINGQITALNGALSTKLDASVISGYYTKGQTDAKAAEIAAGKVEEFNANLVIGGANLQDNADFKTSSLNRWTGIYGAVTSVAGGIRYKGTSVNGAARLHKTLVGISVGQKHTLSVWAKTPVPLEFRGPVDAIEHNKETPAVHDSSVFQRYTYTFTPSIETGAIIRAYIPNIALADEVIISKEKLEVGSKGTDWSPSSSDVQTSLDANSTAIQNTNAEVSRVDGVATAANNATTALAGRMSAVEGTVATKADASAVNSLTTRVASAEGVNTSQGSAITSLENTVNHSTTGLASKASSTALTAVDNKVTAANGRIDTTNSNVATLSGRVSTVEGAVSTKAEAAALTALTTRVGNAEGVNTSQGTAITTLQNTVNHATTGLATKASTSALTATNSEVSRVNGVVTGHTNQLTQLTSDITAINGTLATKANASALNDIYTKTQADAKATEIAAGEVSKYDASLVIGGANLVADSNKFLVGGGGTGLTKQVLPNGSLKLTGAGGTYYGFYTNNASNSDTSFLNVGDDITVTLWVKAVDVSNLPTVMPFMYLDGPNPVYLNTFKVIGDLSKGGLVRYVQTRKVNRLSSRLGLTHMHWYEGALGGGLIIEKWQIELGTKGTDWTPSNADVQNSLDANATAINNTNTEVARVDGRVTTESSRITTLTGRVDNVVGDLAKKADASALSSLTTRVETEEGKSTSQGTAITALQNTVNHATTGLSTKASSAALTTVDNRVTAVDGRVTTTNSNVTALTGRVSTVEGSLTTKADVAAVNALTTRVGTVEGGLSTQASDITSLKSSIAGTAESVTANGSQATLDAIGQPAANALLSANADSMTGSLVKLKGAVSTNLTNTKLLIDPTKLYKLRMRYRRTAGTTNRIYIAVINYNAAGNQTVANNNVLNPVGTQISSAIYPIAYELPALNAWREVDYYFKGKATGASTGSGTLASPKTFPALAATVDIGVLANYGMGNDLTQEYEIDYLIFEDATNEAANNANAAALSTTDTEVSRINGVVSGHTTQISNLTTSIAGKADASALNSLTARVATEEGKSTSQGTAITNLENAVNNATTGLASKASSQALTTLNNQVQHSTTGLSAVNSKVDTLKATVENTTTGLASKASSSALDTLSNKVNHSTTGLDAVASKTTVLESDVSKALDVVTVKDTRSTNQPPSWYFTNYPSRVINEFKQTAAIGVSGFFGGTYCNLETKVYWSDPSGGDLIQTATSSVDPSLYVQRRSTGTTAWTAWAQPIKDLRDGLAGKAAASAVESLTTRVGTAEGRINTEAGKLTTLSTTVGGHTTTINSQTTSINGIRGVHALKFDTNGVISGYGLISELVNGTVTSQFGVNANNFFIGAPSSNKKPFVVYTSPGLINGVTVPAGTYIDTAFIGDATIDTAHIRDLNVTTAKIGNGAITTAKIGDLQVDTLKIKDNAVTVPIGVRYSNVTIDSDAVRAAMNVYAEAQGWRRADGSWDFPTTLQGSITVWEAGTPVLFNITVPRAGGKCRIDLSLSTSLVTTNGVRTFVAVGPGNQPENVLLDARLFISLYRSGTLIGRTSMAPTSTQGTTVGFIGNLALMALDDTAMTGNVVYTAKISFGYVGSIANTIKITPYFGKLVLEQMTVSALEIKK